MKVNKKILLFIFIGICIVIGAFLIIEKNKKEVKITAPEIQIKQGDNIKEAIIVMQLYTKKDNTTTSLTSFNSLSDIISLIENSSRVDLRNGASVSISISSGNTMENMELSRVPVKQLLLDEKGQIDLKYAENCKIEKEIFVEKDYIYFMHYQDNKYPKEFNAVSIYYAFIVV